MSNRQSTIAAIVAVAIAVPFTIVATARAQQTGDRNPGGLDKDYRSGPVPTYGSVAVDGESLYVLQGSRVFKLNKKDLTITDDVVLPVPIPQRRTGDDIWRDPSRRQIPPTGDGGK